MAKPKPEQPLVQIPFRFKPDFVSRLRKYCEESGKSMNQAAFELMDRQLSVRGH